MLPNLLFSGTVIEPGSDNSAIWELNLSQFSCPWSLMRGIASVDVGVRASPGSCIIATPVRIYADTALQQLLFFVGQCRDKALNLQIFDIQFDF